MTLLPQLSSKSDVKSPLMTSQKSTQTLSSVTSSKLTQFPSQLKINKKKTKNKKTNTRTRMTSQSNPSPLIKSHKHSSYATSSTMTSQKHIYPDTHMTSQELSCTMTSQKHPVEAHMTSQKRQNSVTSSKRPSVTPE